MLPRIWIWKLNILAQVNMMNLMSIMILTQALNVPSFMFKSKNLRL